MALNFLISTPGKIILHGEHSVVYGKTALAASVNLRTFIDFQESPESSAVILKSDAINLQYEFDVNAINTILNSSVCTNTVWNISPTFVDHDRFLKNVIQFVDSTVTNDTLNHTQKTALYSFIYLLLAILSSNGINKISGCRVSISSDIRVGAGLGSSASFAVCLAGCFFYYVKQIEEFDQSTLNLISQWAYNSEKIVHGYPSGLDNSVCTFGSIVEFRKGENPKPLLINDNDSGLNALLVDTKVSRETKKMVTGVKELQERHPEIINNILEAMDSLTKRAIEFYTSSNMFDKYDNLKELININQALLVALGVSHPANDLVCQLAEKWNFAAKLTGAGGGGYCIILIPPRETNETLSLIEELESKGYSCTQTKLGGPGLTLLR